MHLVRPTFSTALFLFLLAWSAQVAAQRGILWQIDTGQQRASYLFGTVHSDDPRIMKLPPLVERTFIEADSFTAELKMDVMSLMQGQGLLLLTEGRQLADLIGQHRYQQSVALMAARGVPEMLLQRMKPWAVAVQLNLPKSQSGIFLDMLLYQRASAAGKAVYGLERMEEQMAVFDGMSTPQQIVFLEESIKYVGEVPAMIENITRLYLDRDLTALQSYSDRLMSRGDGQLSQALQERLIVARNQRMVERMQARLDEGNAFIAVGALHLPGEQGILHLLQNQGYRVKPLY